MPRPSPWALSVLLALGAAATAASQCPDGSLAPNGDNKQCGRNRVVAMDSHRVLVIPFSVQGPQSLQYLGGPIVGLFQNAIDAAGNFRVVRATDLTSATLPRDGAS